MCGFAGIWAGEEGRRFQLAPTLERMSDTLHHRGPDDGGLWSDDDRRFGLGFRRLSILELSALGHQPMQSRSGRWVIVFNGEIYNHRALRGELARSGRQFRGGSDTEVILEAVDEWGIHKALSRLAGMFAIAVWDRKEHALHLVRDRLGIKPLYIAWDAGVLSFGSELKALVEVPGFDRTLDRDALLAYFRYHYVPEPRTVYRRVRKLLPGHVLTITDPSRDPPASVPYWSLIDVARTGRADPFVGNDQEAVDWVHHLLRETIEEHLQADVPLGAFLSGGIDSSLVVALMQDTTGRAANTYSIAFDEGDYDEAEHASRVARHLGSQHTELRLTAGEALAVVPSLPEMFDEPFANPAAIANFLVSRLARREVTIAMSGTGGDEVFAGYSRYVHGERLVRAFRHIPRPARRIGSAAITSIPSVAWDRAYGLTGRLIPRAVRRRLPNFRGSKVVKMGELMSRNSPLEMYRSILSAWDPPSSLVLGGVEPPASFEGTTPHFESLSANEWMEGFMLIDQQGYLVGDQLAMVDRVSMAVSLEARVPLLDHRLVEAAWHLPRRFKLRDGGGKWVLRQVLHRYVPPEMLDRPKMGLSIPVGRWLAGPLRPWAEELLDVRRIERDGVLRAEPIRTAWQELLSGREQHAQSLWAVLMFQAWQDRWQGAAVS